MSEGRTMKDGMKCSRRKTGTATRWLSPLSAISFTWLKCCKCSGVKTAATLILGLAALCGALGCAGRNTALSGDPVTLAKSQLPEGWGVLAMDKVKTDFTTSSWLTANPVVVEGEKIEDLRLFFCFQEAVPLKLHHVLYGPPDGSTYAAVGSLKFATAEDARIGYGEMSREFYDIDKSVHARFGFDKTDPKTVFYVYVPAGRTKDFEHFSKYFGSVAVEPTKK